MGRPDKPFQPHITIARIKSMNNKDRLISLINEFENQSFGKELIDSLKFKKSTLTPSGPIYEDLHVFPFLK